MLQLEDNVFNARQGRGMPMLKLWRSAGLMLTYRCNAACRFCYYHCSPDAGGLMPVETAIAAWAALRRLAGDGAKVHLTGGEPFLVFDRLLEICLAAQRQGWGGADYVETNAGWVADEIEARQRLRALDEAGLGRLKISCDVFHAEFVSVEKVRVLMRIAREILGPDRVLVRWEKNLTDSPTATPASRDASYIAAMKTEAGRFTGRAAEQIAPLCADQTVAELAGLNCRSALLGAKGVHIDPYGHVFCGQCSGMALGNVNTAELDALWQQFDPENDDFWKILFAAGPAGFLSEAQQAGYLQQSFYASKCHLCTHIRGFYFDNRRYLPIITPDDCYGKQRHNQL